MTLEFLPFALVIKYVGAKGPDELICQISTFVAIEVDVGVHSSVSLFLLVISEDSHYYQNYSGFLEAVRINVVFI